MDRAMSIEARLKLSKIHDALPAAAQQHHLLFMESAAMQDRDTLLDIIMTLHLAYLRLNG